MNRKIVFAVIVTALVLMGYFIFSQNKNAKYNPTPSYRTSLTPTPNTEGHDSNWKTFTDPTLKLTFEYPDNLQTKYIRAQNWPPKIKVTSDKFSCKEKGQIAGQPLIIQKIIGDTTYCIENVTEGAAGTFYSNYSYTLLKENKLITLQFTLAYSQCDNFEDLQKQECQKERQSFDLDTLINQITQTIQLQSDIPLKSGPVIISPQANSKVSSPLIIKGAVPAGWMFEGVFPIKLLDENRKIIVQNQAREVVAGIWSSGQNVEFSATLNFSTHAKSGFLVLEKDNPSGLPSNADSFEIPVNF